MKVWVSRILTDAKAAAMHGQSSLPYKPEISYAKAAGGIYIGRVSLDNGVWDNSPNQAMRISEETRITIREALVKSLTKGETSGGLRGRIEHLIIDAPGT